MKNLIIGGVVAAMPGAAVAGPALDAFINLFPAEVEVSYDAEQATDGAEIYDGLRVTSAGDVMTVGRAALRLSEERVLMSGVDLNVREGDAHTTKIAEVSLALPLALESLSPDMIRLGDAGAFIIDPALCDVLDARTEIQLRDVSMEASLDGGDVNMDAFDVNGEVVRPETDCVLDFAQSVSGLSFTVGGGIEIKAGRQSLEGYSPLTGNASEEKTGETYSSAMSIENVSVFMNDTLQATIGEISAASSAEADSLVGLAESGIKDVASMAATNALKPSDVEEIGMATVWNAIRDVVGGTRLTVSKAEVASDGLAGFSPVPGLLDKGALLDVEISSEKDVENLGVAVTVDATTLGLVDFGVDIVMRKADASLDDVAPAMFLMAAPVEVAGARVKLSDRGASDAVAALIGEDPYAVLRQQITANIGGQKADLVTDWVENAQDGSTAKAAISPSPAMPVMQLIGLLSGSWNGAGAALGLTTGPDAMETLSAN